MAAGIPVIVLDRKVEGDKYTCFIGGDNVKIGEEAGKFMVKLLGGKGNIVELKGLMTSTPAVERHEGFMKGIKGSQIKIIFDADCHWLEPDAQKEMTSALSRFPEPRTSTRSTATTTPARTAPTSPPSTRARAARRRSSSSASTRCRTRACATSKRAC